LLGSVLGALIVTTATPAGAQFNFGGAKQDENAPILFRADEIQYDEQLALTIARGHVEIAQGG